MIVASDGSGDVLTIQEAVDAVPPDNRSPFLIQIRPGTYREKVRIEQPHVWLVGEDPVKTVLTWADHAWKTFPDGRRYGTFESYTLLVTGENFRAEGLTIENAAGPGSQVGQAVAAYVDADRAEFHRCRFLGNQDTLFTGPLPPFPLTAATFGGPREASPRVPVRQYYGDCFFRGDVDFLFGSATAVFQRCEVFSQDRGEPVNGWITAASTPEGVEHGYVFLDCRLTGDAGEGTVYLGRPWRDFAQTVFVRCWMGPHIHPEGWHDWDKPMARLTSYYAEGLCQGPGAGGLRTKWAHTVTDQELDRYSVGRILAGNDGWNPEKSMKITGEETQETR